MKILILLALLPLAAQAQTQNVNVSQSTLIKATPDTQLIDSSDVKLPSSCEFRGPIARSSPLYIPTAKAAMKNLRKAVQGVNANVVVVTVLNLNSGIPMAGLGYHCSDLKEVTPSIKVFILPATG